MCREFRCAMHKDVPELRNLWKEAFGDSDAYLDSFFTVAFSPDRCRVAIANGTVAAMLYWFECACWEQNLVYVYAVATKKELQGKGLSSALMENLNTHLEELGVAGIILVPGSEDLIQFYMKRGYELCAPQKSIVGKACGESVCLQEVAPEKYGELRRKRLPCGAVVQEGKNLEFLSQSAKLYSSDDILLAAAPMENGSVLGLELLCQDPDSRIPGILRTLNAEEGVFRVPSEEGKPFALFHPLKDWVGDKPVYFAFAFE